VGSALFVVEGSEVIPDGGFPFTCVFVGDDVLEVRMKMDLGRLRVDREGGKWNQRLA
jgi:hypothetical protein